MNEWMNHPKMQNMDPIKLELIKMAAAQTAGKSGKDLAPILFALITNAGKHNIQFSPEEITLILDLLKEGKVEVKVLKSHDKWFGVTYKEDKPMVMDAIQNLKDQGLYPQKLWEEA